MSSWVFVIVFFSLISLSQQSGLDCDSISHSCASCINFGCSWCQGETNELSFCSKNTDHCRHGSLLEDSLFCPKSEPLFESIEWWGENAFFSRSLTCDDLQLSAIYCLTWGSSIPGYCIWCQDGCQALLDPFCYQGTYATHYDGSDPSDTVLEGQEITLNLNPYVLLYRESNTTAEESTSTYLSISAIFSPATTGCTLSLSGDDLTVTVVDEYIGQCTVRIEFLPRSNFAELGLPQSRTRVVLYYTVTSTQQNDPPEQSAKVGTIFSNFSLEEDDTNTGKINGCDLFVDKDKDTFTLSFATSDSVLSVTAASCICPTGCPLTFTTGSVEGDTDVVVTFTADDGNGGVGSFEQTIKVLNLKYTPTVTSPISTVELEEIPDETVSVDLAAHFEIEDDSTLSYNVEVAPTLVSYELNSETGLLTFTSAGELFGSENVTVSAASEDRKAVIQFLLRVTPVNDPPVVVKESESYRQNAGTQLIVPISTFVTDPDGDVLTCGPQSDDQARVQFANGNMTISFLKKTTEPSRFEITCTDAGGVQAQFNLEISVTLDNRAPQIIKNFTQIKFAPTNTDDFDLTFYFSDADIPLGDTLTYTAVSSNSTLLKFDIQGNILTVTADANAAGLYSLSVTATDSANSTATQSLPVLIYRAVTCSDFQKSWTPTAPLIISFATECTYFLPFTVAFQERQDTGSLYNEITPELNGTDLILKHTSGCSGGGSYLGIVTLTDGYTLVNRTLRVSVTQTNTLVTAKTSYSYVVVDQLGTTTGYDGEFRLSSSSTVRIDLNAVVQSCAQVAQSLTFSNTTSIDGQFLDQAKKAVSGAIKGEFGKDTTGYYLLLKSNPTPGSGPVPLIRAWELSFGVKVVDGKGSSVTFSVRVTKPNNSGNMTGNATGVATGNS